MFFVFCKNEFLFEHFLKMGFFTVVLIGIIIFGIAYLAYDSGLFYKVTAIIKPFEEVQIAYVPYVGPYNQAYRETSKVEEAIKKATNVDLSKSPCVGIYYDDPRKVEKTKCRAIEGKILPKDFERKPIDGINYASIPYIEKSIQVQHPLKNFLSIFAGIFKAYPAIHKCETDNNLKVSMAMFEIYGWEGDKILFVAGTGEPSGILAEFPHDKQN